jgi:hypothetical protein
MDRQENANQRLNKVVLTLNSAGSSARNPILSGLGVRAGIQLDSGDALRDLYAFRDRANMGANLIGTVAYAGAGLYQYDFRAGTVPTASGSPTLGALKNIFRYVSKYGATEQETWIKSYDCDVVTLAGAAALDETTLIHVCVEVSALGGGATWIPVPIGFMPSWVDEFNRPCYGGAAFVSVFEAVEGVDGVVEAITDHAIATLTTVNVENTVGEKHFKVRFRSKAASVYCVDVDVCVKVLPLAAIACYPPEVDPCADVLLVHGTLLPGNTPAVASTPGVQVVAGTPGLPVAADLLIIAMQGYTVGAAPTMVIRRWAETPSPTDLGGVQFARVGADVVYLPLMLADTISVPDPGAPYGPGTIYCIALSRTQLSADNVSVVESWIVDGNLRSAPMISAASRVRDLCGMLSPETGGGDGCCGTTLCVGGGTPTPGS